MHVLFSIFITFIGYISSKMTSILTDGKAQMEKLAFIMTAIVLDFDFVNRAFNYGAEEFSKLHFVYETPVCPCQ